MLLRGTKCVSRYNSLFFFPFFFLVPHNRHQVKGAGPDALKCANRLLVSVVSLLTDREIVAELKDADWVIVREAALDALNTLQAFATEDVNFNEEVKSCSSSQIGGDPDQPDEESDDEATDDEVSEGYQVQHPLSPQSLRNRKLKGPFTGPRGGEYFIALTKNNTKYRCYLTPQQREEVKQNRRKHKGRKLQLH